MTTYRLTPCDDLTLEDFHRLWIAFLKRLLGLGISSIGESDSRTARMLLELWSTVLQELIDLEEAGELVDAIQKKQDAQEILCYLVPRIECFLHLYPDPLEPTLIPLGHDLNTMCSDLLDIDGSGGGEGSAASQWKVARRIKEALEDWLGLGPDQKLAMLLKELNQLLCMIDCL